MPEQKKPHVSLTFIVTVAILFTLSIGSSFAGGFFLRSFLTDPVQPDLSVSPTPTTAPQTSEPQPNSQYVKGKQYFDDTVIAITDDDEPLALVATVARQETQNGSNQSTRVSYYDGQEWTRKTLVKEHETAAIYTDDIVSSWEVTIDPTRVLKQRVEGAMRINQAFIEFDTGEITNNIAVRSLPGYTKFMSNGSGTVTVDGITRNAHILYVRIYSNNSEEIQFYSTPFDITTHWLIFWDQQGNAYHIDSTYVDRPTDKYQSHQFGVFVTQDGMVSKTFEVTVDTDTNEPPQSYTIRLGDPIGRTISFTPHSSLNKAPDNSYGWYIGHGAGTAVGVPGIGLVEYIHR